jgi:hypothetical protein
MFSDNSGDLVILVTNGLATSVKRWKEDRRAIKSCWGRCAVARRHAWIQERSAEQDAAPGVMPFKAGKTAVCLVSIPEF